jgi:hypothetical protein
LKKCLLLRTSFWAAIYLSIHPLGAYPGEQEDPDGAPSFSSPSVVPPPPFASSPSRHLPLDDGRRHEKWQAFLTGPFASKNPQRALLGTYEDSLSYCLVHDNGEKHLEALVQKCQQGFASQLAKSRALIPPNFLEKIHLQCVAHPPQERETFFLALTPGMVARCSAGFELMRLAGTLWSLSSADRPDMSHHIDAPLLSLCTNGLNVTTLINAFALFPNHEERKQLRGFLTQSVLLLCKKKPRLEGKDLVPSVMAVAKIVSSFQKIPRATQRQNVFDTFTEQFFSHCHHQRHLLTTINTLITLSTINERPLFPRPLLSLEPSPSDLRDLVNFYGTITDLPTRQRVYKILASTFFSRCIDTQTAISLSQMILEVDRRVPAADLSAFFSLPLIKNAQDLTQLSKYSVALAAVPSQGGRQEINDIVMGPFSQCYPNPDDRVAYVRALGAMSAPIRTQVVKLVNELYLPNAKDPTQLKRLLEHFMKTRSSRRISSLIEVCDEDPIKDRQTPESLRYLLCEFSSLSPKRQRLASQLWDNRLSQSYLCGQGLVEALVEYATTPGKRRRAHMEELLTPRFVALCHKEMGEAIHTLRPLPQSKRRACARFLVNHPELLFDAQNNSCTIRLLEDLLFIDKTCLDVPLKNITSLSLLGQCQTYERFHTLARALAEIPTQEERVEISGLVEGLTNAEDLVEDVSELMNSLRKISDSALRSELCLTIKEHVLSFCQSAEDVTALVQILGTITDYEKRRKIISILQNDLLHTNKAVCVFDAATLLQYLATLEDHKRDALWEKVRTYLLPHGPTIGQICDLVLAMAELDDCTQNNLLRTVNKHLVESLSSDLGDYLEAIATFAPQDQWDYVPTLFTAKVLKEAHQRHDSAALVKAAFEIENASSRRQVMTYFHTISDKITHNRAPLIKALGNLESDEERAEIFSYLTDAILKLHGHDGEALTPFIETVSAMKDKELRLRILKAFTEQQASFCQSPQSAVMILKSLWKSAQRKEVLHPGAPTQSHTQSE